MATGGNVYIFGSTISDNLAGSFAALVCEGPAGTTASIINSTISGNVASNRFSGVYTQIPLTLSNSTIAFNQDRFGGGALYTQASTLTLQSSIIADNIRGSASGSVPDDLYTGNSATITGANNLITSSNHALPLDTITGCPRLGPLADNGGPTLTHALLHTSPAIDTGNTTSGTTVDQRGDPRPFGAAADIGAYEWQGTPDDRLFASGFEPSCDR